MPCEYRHVILLSFFVLRSQGTLAGVVEVVCDTSMHQILMDTDLLTSTTSTQHYSSATTEHDCAGNSYIKTRASHSPPFPRRI